MGDIGIRLASDTDKLSVLLRSFYVTSGGLVGRFRLRLLDRPPQFLDERILAFVDQFGLDRAVRITATQQSIAQGIVNRGLVAEESTTAIAKRLDDILPALYKNRGLTVARTEIGFATSKADDLAADDSGLPLTKFWLTAADGGNRHPSAPGLHGQQRAKEDPFDVRGYDMQHPHDWAGPASETVNCRCSVSYEAI
jgi:hypothetical protein